MTVHSVVAFYRNPEGQLRRHSILMLTDDAVNDHHAMNTSPRRTIRFLQNLLPVRSDANISANSHCQSRVRLPKNFQQE
ncbi:hypothetical protein PoB_004831300 [Plakobranchus ocellatus]|uniref:Uncharacterized protein n=1 Tax=Plakobranchus ocellatus TaxID=259542 RepID=A0AAV4BSI8_9GAST|nr:hypothetical protein PoB_004831300 [Plakobranchus ocellatus]